MHYNIGTQQLFLNNSIDEQVDFVCSRHGMSWDVDVISESFKILRFLWFFHDTELHVSTFTGMAEDGWLPSCFAQRSRFDTPWLPLLVITVLVLVPKT